MHFENDYERKGLEIMLNRCLASTKLEQKNTPI